MRSSFTIHALFSVLILLGRSRGGSNEVQAQRARVPPTFPVSPPNVESGLSGAQARLTELRFSVVSQNAIPLFDTGPFFDVKVASAKECEKACAELSGCRAYYYGTGYVCADDGLPGAQQPKSCSLFPRPFRSRALDPFKLGTILYSPSNELTIGENKNKAIFASAGWWYSDETLIADTSRRTSKQCKEWCDADASCKAWSHTWGSNKPLCEKFNEEIAYPGKEEAWKVNLADTASLNGFGGIAANLQPGFVRVGPCDDVSTKKLLNQYEACLIKAFKSNGGITKDSCSNEIAKVEKHFETCMPLPPNDPKYTKGESEVPECSIKRL